MKRFFNGAASSSVPGSSRRNFRLSGLEILIVVLILVGVAYLASMWVSNMFSSEPEAAAPVTAPGTLVERALAASEKALAQLAATNKDISVLRKDLEAVQARRPAGPGQGQGQAQPSAGLERRLEEMEKQLQSLAHLRDEKAVASLSQDMKALLTRLDKLEREAAKPTPAAPPAAAPAPAGPGIDPKTLNALEGRLQKIEQGLGQVRETMAKAPAAAPVSAPDPGTLQAELARQQTRLAQQVEEMNRLQQELAREVGQLKAARQAVRPPAAPEPAAPAPKAEAKPEPRPAPPSPPRVEARPPAAPKPPPAPARVSHKVRSGETITGLARRYRVTPDDIVRWNAQQLGERRSLLIGETISIIPGPNS